MSAENDLRHPVKFFDKGYCPKCHKGIMVYTSTEHIGILLDEYGFPAESYVMQGPETLHCCECGFKGRVGENYIKLEDGSYKFVTEAEMIYEADRISRLPSTTHLHADRNPFVE